MLKKIKNIILKTDRFLYKKFGSDRSTKFLENIKEAQIIFSHLNDIGKESEVRFVGGCVRKAICGEIIDYIKSQKGCYFSRITGSGSACIGIFSNMRYAIYAKKLIKLKYPKYWCAVSKTI